jgi:hypothetical protein
MEAQQVLEELGEPLIAFITGHEVIEVDNKKVAVSFESDPSSAYTNCATASVCEMLPVVHHRNDLE